MEEIEIYVDGACRGNPGEAAIGVIFRKDGKCFKEISKAIGQATNNIAEYAALICALEEALVLKAKKIKLHTDSELMFNQLSGGYKIKSEHLKPLFDQAQKLLEGFQEVKLQKIPREQNQEADGLASKMLKKKTNRDGCLVVLKQ
jgi:ribonuclease HI